MKLVPHLLLAICFTLVFSRPTMAQEPIDLTFELMVGDETASCNQNYHGIGSMNSTISFADLRFYVSNIRLIDNAGQAVTTTLAAHDHWQSDQVALLDFEDKTGRCDEIGTEAMNSLIKLTAPSGNYNGIKFNLGVPFSQNHQDVTLAPTPLNIPALQWNWQGGYKFARFDIYNDNETNNFWPIHLGSTGCTSDNGLTPPDVPCSQPNLPEITLTNFDPTSDVIVADMATLLSAVDVSTSTLKPPGCMSGQSDPDCPNLFSNLGLSLETGQCVNDCQSQTLFQVKNSSTMVYLPMLIQQAPMTVDLNFTVKVGDETARCNQSYPGVGSANTAISFADLRFYISNIRLIDNTGQAVTATLAAHDHWQSDQVALLDFEDKTGRCDEIGTEAMNSLVKLTAPAGNYNGIKFNVGVPFSQNHQDVTLAPTPLNIPALQWNWQGGYKFVRLDIYNDNETNNFWPIHLGSTGCTSDNGQTSPESPCSQPNLPEITLTNFDPTSDLIVADIATLLTAVDVSTSTLKPPGCMFGQSDPDCPNLFSNLGLSLETGQCVDDCQNQTLFRLENQ